MKKASRYLKQLFSAIVAAVKARSTAVGTKASSLRTRLIVLGIMRNKKLLLSAIQSKIHAIMGGGSSGHHQHQGSSSSGGYGGNNGNAVASGHGGGGEGERGLFLASSSGARKAAVLQSLPSFAVEQEARAVVLLSSLPSFALERDAGGANEDKDTVEEAAAGEKLLLATVDTTAAAPGSAAEGEFRLEDEIDRVADVFIRRFHEQMKLQKLESFKRFCEMLERGA
ncbi:hypothetical protein BDA96_04G163300 [Sorghum bicolor]|jgi:hypothetical protein|uniref:DUF761 domain-containing protein n=2 Tax=Sorghum bicolor TaxID=4558 RepID=A0A921R6H6_SORBI|nr:uncharacterized protein LOC8056076 [Sorghum bicolor]EES06855.1 hypothetical protein SORBI_3004G153700 [Sorghum bicolor]KAG0533100.1 hypothetical protein BDA96_04G163300 [Sorghum bicolor]|eukprot:XP_002453879.1 uncharacterized protein LOC8056076 [Sorghum bicolor]